jgi:thiosulfate/3-mercaptopyruvate sulfurtransferase
MPRFTIARLVLACLGAAFVSLVAAQGEPGVLVTPKWLQQHLHDPGLVILQIGTKPTFVKEHIAGSQFITMRDLSVEQPTSLSMPPEDSLRHQLERFGISDNSRVVVVFSDEWVSPSTRTMFTLYYAGLGDRSSLLDGGLDEWKRANLPVTDAVVAVKPGKLTRHVNPFLIVDHAFMQANGATAHVRLVDARTPEFYSGPDIVMKGTDKPMEHPVGHVAGAKNIPFNSVWDDSNRVLPKARLLEMFKAAGITPGDTVVAYCHVGQQATALLFAARSAGFTTRLYDGSMDDWNARKLPLVKTP